MGFTKEQNREWQEKRRIKMREMIENDKNQRGYKCQYCGYNKMKEILLFHHRDPNQKKFKINLCSATRSLESLQKELDKCDLICKNCHAEVHYDDWKKHFKQFKNDKSRSVSQDNTDGLIGL